MSDKQALIDAVFAHIDRMNDICDEDKAVAVLNDFVKAVEPHVLAMIAAQEQSDD